MTDERTLEARIEAELAAADDRIRTIRQEAAGEFQDLEARHRRFVEIGHTLIEDPRAGQLKKLEAMFDNAQVTRHEGRSGYYGVIEFRNTPRFPATVKLKIGLSHDAAIRHIALSCDVEILPVFMDYERHDEITFPLEQVDSDALFAWLDDKIVGFVRTYMELQFAEQYQMENLVTDPVIGMRFPKIQAAAQEKRAQHTYYFLTEDSHTLFKENPDRYVA